MVIGIDASRAVTTQRTGTEAYAYFLIKALLPLAHKKGHQVRLYFNQSPPHDLFFNSPLDHKIEKIVIPFPRLWTHGRLAIELYQRPPDVFFTPAHVIPYTFNGRSAATVHDLGYHYFPSAHTKSQLRYLKWSTQHNCQQSRRIIADSIATKRDLENFYQVDSNKIEVIYPGIDPTLEPVEDETLIQRTLAKYGISQPYLLYIGTLQPRKNLVRLVQAYASSGVEHQLVLAGRQGWLAQPILDAIAKLPTAVQSKIKLTGYVSEEEKAPLLSRATALLFPSLYEGFGFPVLEAQACETAVLCSNSSSLPEVAGKGALFVEPESVASIGQGIQQLCSSTELRQSLIQKGSVNVKQFSWETAVFQLLSTLETM